MSKPRGISPDFLDLMNYSLCSAVTKLAGKKMAEDIFRLTGEIAFEELKTKLALRKTKPFDTLERIARYLESSGYMSRITLEKVDEHKIRMNAYGITVGESAARLSQQNLVISHFMTNIMFATLRKMYGSEVKLKKLLTDELSNKKHGTELWVIGKAK